MGWLRIVTGPNIGTRFHLAQRSITIGRDPTNSIQILDPQVSRHHAYLRFVQGRYYVQDMHSANGLFVNGRRVEHVELHHGDRIGIGRVEFQFEPQERPGAVDARAVAAYTQETDPRGMNAVAAAQMIAARAERVAASQTPRAEAAAREARVLLVLAGLDDLGKRGAPLSDLCEHLLPSALGLLVVDRVMLLLPVAGTTKLRTAAYLERLPLLPGMRRPAFHVDVIRQAVATRGPHSAEFTANELTHPSDPRVAACAPLLPRRRLNGALYVDRLGREVQPFTAKERRLLHIMGSQLGMYLTNDPLD